MDFNYRLLLSVGIPATIAANTLCDMDLSSIPKVIFSTFVLSLFAFSLTILFCEYKRNNELHSKKNAPLDLILIVIASLALRLFIKNAGQPIISLKWWCIFYLAILFWEIYTFRVGCKNTYFNNNSLSLISLLETLIEAMAKNFKVSDVSLCEEYRYWIALDGFALLMFSILYFLLTFLNIHLNQTFYLLSISLFGFYIVLLNGYRYSLIFRNEKTEVGGT